MSLAVVTGAGRGIGRATARRLAADGWNVVVVDVDGATAKATAAELPGAQARECDVSDAEAVRQLAADVGPVAALVNNAGIWRYASLEDTTPQDALAVLQVNVLGTYWCCQAFAPG
ncbi:MAG TPA: SDR family oxidoreductase, partial [Acidimicrobiales bacterium]|nr:SDR family oxidoreductase [Acidimicrobiales bacterium]